MGKSAKMYKRPTKKEKLGLSAGKQHASNARAAEIQRHAPISKQMLSGGNVSGGGGGAREYSRFNVNEGGRGGLRDLEDHSAVSQAAQKLLLEAEKRALASSSSSKHLDATSLSDGEEEVDTEMQPVAGNHGGVGGKKRSSAGASALKKKASKRKAGTADDGSKSGKASSDTRDYVDLFEGRNTRRV